MNFLNPLVLFGLLAASLPLLIHLLTRIKSRTVPFSTLTFLKELQNDQIRRIKLRQLLLLLIRTLILIFLVLAFARPTLKGSLAGLAGSNAKTSMVIIFDNSKSMNRSRENQTLFQTAQQKAQHVADLLKPGDEAYLLTTTDTSRISNYRSFHDPVTLKKALKNIKMNFQRTDISASLTQAVRLLSTSYNINKEIYLVSDLQRSGFTDSISIHDTVQLYCLPLVSESSTNLTVESFELASTVLEKGRIAQANVTITNSGTSPINNSLVQLYWGNTRVAQSSVELATGESTVLPFNFNIKESGFSSLRVRLEEDDLVDDNQAEIVFFVPDLYSIGLSGNKRMDTYFVQMALNPQSRSSTRYKLKSIPWMELDTEPFDDLDVLLLSNVPQINQQSSEKIAGFVENGGGLVLVMGSAIDVPSYNNGLLSRLNLPAVIDILGSANLSTSKFTLGQNDLTHPLFSGMFTDQEAQFSYPTFRFAVKVEQTADIDPLMEYSNGDPFLFEKRLARGVILVITTGFDLQLSNLGHKTVFAPLISRLVGYAAVPRDLLENNYVIGEEIRYKIPSSAVNATLEMQRPDETYDRLKPEITPSGPWVIYSQTDEPGIYKLLADSRVINANSVHFDPEEMDFTPVDMDHIQDTLKARVLSENIGEVVKRQRHGTELWKYFVFGVLVLLILEMVLYREKGETSVADKR